METLDPILKAADYASTKDDRWLMLLMLFIMVAGGVFMVRWFIKRLEVLGTESRTDRDHYEEHMSKMNDSQQSIIKDLSGVISLNTKALDGNREEMKRLADKTEEWHRRLEDLRREAK